MHSQPRAARVHDRRVRALAILALLVCASCANDEPLPVDAPGSGTTDAAATSDGGADATTNGNGVLCAREDQSCVAPTPECCDVTSGTDTCVGTNDPCSGDRLECDGPEDCPASQECCLFDGQGSRCLDTGICGTTGSISNEMCHVAGDCDANENCCGTAPGPALDLYSICTTSPCPQ
jgi:hypothetical protein